MRKGTMAAQLNSFVRFLFGFSLFIAASLGLAFVVGTYSIERDKEEQAAAARNAMLNISDESPAWAFWK